MKMFPKRKPYQKGYFAVGGGHEIFYSLYGNPKGIPVLFVHGGPGAGCNDDAHRHFNPKKFNILTVDQRGAGKSRPYAGLRANTTQELVQDFRKLLGFLKIKKVFLFGGSWGSCLSLCYAIKYPEQVMGMVLRGIYLGTRYENEYFLNGGPKTHFPEVWERFLSFVPKKSRRNPAGHYWKMMNSRNSKVSYKYCYEWTLYESSMLRLIYDPKKVRKSIQKKWVESLAKLEAKYLLNDCFLPPNYIMRNAKKIANIPTSLVHGRYDFVCTPDIAYNLHKALPKSKLNFVLGGHSIADPAVRSLLMKEIHEMAGKYGNKR
jgi:proline iminopeptidase